MGESYTPTEPESYATLYSLLTSNATSNAQKAAAASLSATDPTDGANLYVSDAEALALGFIGLPAVSAANPDGWIGFFSQGGTFDYSSNPDQVPPTNEDDFLGVVEHEISEVMGRASPVGDVSGGEKASGNYAPIDLFRYTETSGGTPSETSRLSAIPHISRSTTAGLTLAIGTTLPRATRAIWLIGKR